MGFSFAVFYTICACHRAPGRRQSRRGIAIGVLVWSLMTALCGIADLLAVLVFRMASVSASGAIALGLLADRRQLPAQAATR